MSVIFIFSINSIGRHLVSFMIEQNCNCSMLNPCIKCLIKQCFCFLRHRRSCNIPILRNSSQYGIPYTSSDRISLIIFFTFSGNTIFRFSILICLLINLYYYNTLSIGDVFFSKKLRPQLNLILSPFELCKVHLQFVF